MSCINILSYTQQIEPNTFEPRIEVSLEIYPFDYSNDKMRPDEINTIIGEDIVDAIIKAQRKWITDEHTRRNSPKEEDK